MRNRLPPFLFCPNSILCSRGQKSLVLQCVFYLLEIGSLFLPVEDILHQRLYEVADFSDIVRHRTLLEAQLVRHFLLRGAVIEQAENPAVLRLDFTQHGDEVFQDRLVRILIEMPLRLRKSPWSAPTGKTIRQR